MTAPLPIVLIVGAEDEALAEIGACVSTKLYAPLVARSWASVAESLGVIKLAAAVVHWVIEDADPVSFCAGLRSLEKQQNLPIILLLPGVGRAPLEGEPFNIAMKFPSGPGVLADNLSRVIGHDRERLSEAVRNLKMELAYRTDSIDDKTYYEILEVTPSSGFDEITTAYDRFSIRFHPDRLRLLPAAERSVRPLANRFYVYVTEAYQVLTDHRRRKAYDAGLSGGNMRLDETAALPDERRSYPDMASHPNAKRYLRLAEQQVARGDMKSAAMMGRMALGIEPDNRHIGRLLETLEREEE